MPSLSAYCYQRRRPARHEPTTGAGCSSPATATRSTASPTTPATWRDPGRPRPGGRGQRPAEREVHQAAPHQRGRAVAGPAHDAPQGEEGRRVRRRRAARPGSSPGRPA